MKEKILEHLSTVIEYLEKVLLSTGDFVMEQAPLLIQEFYIWSFWSHIYFLVIGIILCIITIWFHKISARNDNQLYNDSEGLMIVPVGIFGIIGIIMTLYNIYNIIYITVAPRLYLIDYLRSIL